jgi:hypothetical protein
MNILGSVITAGVVILAIALLTYATGKTMVSLPGFSTPSTTTDPAYSAAGGTFNATMVQVQANAATAFTLMGISPLVLGAAVIITILIGAFVFTQMQE